MGNQQPQSNRRPSLPVLEAFLIGWAIFKKQAVFIVALMVFIYVVAGFFVAVEEQVRTDSTRFLLARGVDLIVAMFLQLGITAIFFKLYDGKPTKWVYLFSQQRLIIPFFLASLGFVFMAAGPAILVALLIGQYPDAFAPLQVRQMLYALSAVPLLAVVATYELYSYAMVDHQLGGVESLRQSAALTRGYRLWMVGFIAMAILLNVLGFLLWMVGLLVTAPVSTLAGIHIYRFLGQRHVFESDALEEEKNKEIVSERIPQTMTTDETGK